MDKETFKKYGYDFVDWVADYLDNVDKYPVCSPLQPGEVTEKLQTRPPLNGEPMEQIFNDFKELIIPGITHWQHPGWFAYFPANNSHPSVLAELLTAGLGVQAMSWQTSPAAAELEEVVMDWLRRMIGLPEGMAGVIQDTASTSTLCALLTAREVATDYSANKTGVRAPLVVYTSEEAHSSVEKGVKIAGFGSEQLRLIPTNSEFALIPSLLEEAILNDRARGMQPACVVATLGTTSSAAVDPLLSIGEICRRYNLWFHVDGAYAGATGILEEKRSMFKGIEMADSFVFNPHKWLMTNFDCSAYFVKDREQLIKTFEIMPEYLKTAHDRQVNNYRDWGIQLGRRFRALKLWFVIRSYGVEGLQSIIREHLRLAKLFQQWVEEDNSFEIAAPVHFGLVCFRLKKGHNQEEEAKANADLLRKINSTGEVFLTHTTLKGRYTLRFSVGSRATEEKHVRKAWEIIRKR